MMDEAFDMSAAKAAWKKKLPSDKKSRQARHNKLTKSVDGRHLRATGRVAQFNFRALPETKKRAQAAAASCGISLAEWMETAVNDAIAAMEQKAAK